MGAFLGSPARLGCFTDSFPTPPSIVWARVEPASGGSEWNGGVVVDDEVAVAVGSGYRCHVAALDSRTGETRWTVDPPTALKQTFAKAGTLIADGVVYFGSNEGLHALDGKDGTQRWVAKLRSVCGAPLHVGDTIVIGAGAHLYAIDRATGRKAWKVPASPHGVVAYRDSTFYLHGGDSLLALDAESRNVTWTAAAFGGAALHAGPAVTAERVVFVAPDGGLACVDRATGSPQWTTAVTDSVYAHPFAVSTDRVVVKTLAGAIECYDLATGTQQWRSTGGRDKPVSIGHCGPVIAGTTVVCVLVDNSRARGTLTGLDLATGRLLWELDNTPVARAIAQEQTRVGSDFTGTWSWYCTPFVHVGTLYAQADAGLVALR